MLSCGIHSEWCSLCVPAQVSSAWKPQYVLGSGGPVDVCSWQEAFFSYL